MEGRKIKKQKTEQVNAENELKRLDGLMVKTEP
jgi:hypothetical protein